MERALFIPQNNEELIKIVEEHKKNKKIIVYTMGTFDLIHIGHACYLEQAKKFGDILIVGVDPDEVVKKSKGPDRPIVSQEERAAMLTLLRPVDIVTFHSLNPHTIHLVKPDILVISESTKKDKDAFLREIERNHKDYCGEIIMLPPQATTSTTARIRLLMINGMKELESIITQTIKDFIHQKIGG